MTARRLKTYVLAVTAAALLCMISAGFTQTKRADAVIAQMYALPFQGIGPMVCGWHCYYDEVYGWHEGVDFELGAPGVGGHPIAAAARGTAKPCGPSQSAGWYLVMDHGNGHRTRYLHMYASALPSNGQIVARGQVVGYEGATGYTKPRGFNHLHFETRHNASTFTCNKDGTAVDPYAANTYLWTTNPPSTGRDLDASGDGYPDVLGRETATGTICLVRGNGAGGWIPNGDPGCRDGSPIGSGWNVFDRILRPGDWNGDGYNDVLMRNPAYNSGTLCLLAGYRGDGYGYWIPDAPDPICGDATPIGVDWNFFDMILGPGDMNGDGFSDVLGRKPNGDLCLLRGDGHGGWILYSWNQTCHNGTLVGTGWNIYNWLLAPSDWAGNGDSCPDVFARQSTSPYWVKYHSGNCNSGFIEQTGVNIESAWSAFDWLLSVGDFSGGPDYCPDILRRYGGGYYLDMRRGNCNGGFTGAGQVIGYEWNAYNWLF